MFEFRILGPVEVVRDGGPLPLGGAKQRALVADLTLHANEVVSTDRLMDDLWGREPPDTASHMLHVYVSRLRKTLEDHGRGVLVTRPPGYLLKLEPPDELDAARFEAHARRGVEALASRPAEALEIFDRALAWWRGRALEEFADEPFAQPSAARLEELRQAMHEHRVEALLALDRHEEALVELGSLIARFPLRERLRELQMRALYRAGRQGDALQAFQAARRTLADELGVDPGPGLSSLEQAILRQDPELDAPLVEPKVVEPSAAAPPARARIRPWTIAAAIGVVVVLVVVAVRVSTTGGPTGSTGTIAGSTGPLRWTEVLDPQGVFHEPGDQVILGGVSTGDGLLAVGYTALPRSSTSSPRDYDAAVWTGFESTVWNRVNAPAFAAPGNQQATDAVVMHGRIVVVGSDASPGDHDAAVWIHESGSAAWSAVPGLHEPGDQSIRGVTWTGSHLIAVGFTRESDEDPEIAISADAHNWTQFTPTNLVRPGDQEMSGVTRFGDLIVAVGFSGSAEGRDASIWFSRDDGQTWDTVESPALDGDGDQQINDVLAAGPGLVAVGQEVVDGDENAAVWISSDGIMWDRVPDPTGALSGPGAQQMSAVAVSGGLLVAAGTEVAASNTEAAIWTSRDGMTWLRQEPDSPQMSPLIQNGRPGVRALIGTKDGFVALGRKGRGGGDDADVWFGRPST